LTFPVAPAATLRASVTTFSARPASSVAGCFGRLGLVEPAAAGDLGRWGLTLGRSAPTGWSAGWPGCATGGLRRPGLPATLGVTEQALRAGIERSPDLGIAGPVRWPVVWWVNPAPLAAGFEPLYDGERLTLHLAAADPTHRPLVLSGVHLDASLQVELDLDLGLDPTPAPRYGELGYALARLAAMSTRWLAEGHELFSLLNRAWKASPAPLWSSGRLHVHCADLGERIATKFWADGAAATRLELVIWTDSRGGLVLVNAYPCTTEHSIPDPEDEAK